MARLSKHGHELLRLEWMTFQLSYRSDGNIMRNSGHGWKMWRKLKLKGEQLDEWIEMKKERYAAFVSEHPCYMRLRDNLHDLVKRENRPTVYSILKEQAHDADGFFGTMDDFYAGLMSHAEAVGLVEDYKSAQWEHKNLHGETKGVFQ